MENINSYSYSLKKLTDTELLMYIEKPDNFEDDAVIAAIWELKERNLATKKALIILDEIENKKIIRRIGNAEKLEVSILPEEKDIPVLFSK